MGITVVKIRDRYYVAVRWEGKRRHFRAGDTEEEADKIANDIRVLFNLEGEKALDKFGSRRRGKAAELPTIKEYAEAHMKRLKKTSLKETTVNRYTGDLRNHIIPYFGHLPIDGITRKALKQFFGEKVEAGLRRDSIRNIRAALSSMLSEALDEELIQANPAFKIGKFYKAAPKDRDVPDPFSRAEAAAAIEAFGRKYPEYRELFLVLYRTGMRCGEATALQVGDLDFRNSRILIARNLPSSLPVRSVTTPKSKRERYVEMDEELKAALKAFLKRRKEDWLALGKEAPMWLFCDKNGQPHRYDLYRKRWSRVLAAANIRYRSPGQLRHTFASLNLSEGKPLLWVAAELGHKDASLTLTKYSRWMPREKEFRGERKAVGGDE